MKNVYLFQPQYAVEYRNENTFWLPYSVGCIWSYAYQFPDIKESFELKDIVFRREDPIDVLNRMENPSLCGFSCYVWNEKYCLHLAELIKQRWPECVIVFGGAQSSGKMIKYDFIDTVLMAEGEETFLEVLRNLLQEKPPQQFYSKKRLENLDIPSPFTTGVFDKIIEQNPNALWSMTFETNRGCPYACTFCDWGGVTYSKVKKFSIDRVREDLEWCIGKPIGYLFCADANFGIFKDRDVEIAKIIAAVAPQSKIDSINVQYAKNSTDIVFTIAKILGDLNKGVTVSVQSMNDLTLEAIKRKNLDINNIQRLMTLSQEHDVSTYTEVILGLPLETLDSWKQGMADILEMGQHSSIDMWFTQLLENSELSTLAARQQYGIKSIIAKDYTPLYNSIDWRGVEEEIELVNETNTMSTKEMVEAYMYGWMIIHFHITGYSQVIAKYCRHVKNISYRSFYDLLFEKIQTRPEFIEHYQELYRIVDHYLRHGRVLPFGNHNKGGHGIHSASYGYLYENKHLVYKFIRDISKDFGIYDSNLFELSENFVYNKETIYPLQVSLDIDIETWSAGNQTYVIEPRISADSNFDFYFYRRQGWIKNKFKKQ